MKTAKQKICWPKEKIGRNKKIKEMRKKNLSYRAIARIFHISPTRAYQIVNDLR